MNSILHTCTHSNDDSLTRLTEDQMYASIFQYIEHLFEIIKPKETFYMAIDGVAPRAKMNQQRARRFRSAYEAEENLKKAVEQGLEIPKEDPFDSNAITPGTEFMAKLTDNLKYFIHKKITEDSNWSNIKIVLSGHEVPGEGEHKIMEYIRTMRNQSDYNSNSRHCIYGLDADLIMLGLVTHDPHFALLREEVTFGPKSKSKSESITDQKFFLLHISLLREYLSLEFQDLENQLNFEYSFERTLDDLILIMYVIGNDFLPNLPDLFLNKGAFPLLIQTFKESLLHSDGYINDGGVINLKRLNIWLGYLSQFELENFEKESVDVEWFNKKIEDISITGEKNRERIGKSIIFKDEKKIVGLIKPWLMEIVHLRHKELLELESKGQLKDLPLTYPEEFMTKHIEFLKTLCQDLGVLIVHSKSNNTYSLKIDLDGINPNESDQEFEERVNHIKKVFKHYQSANLYEPDELVSESKDIYDKKFMSWKDDYYKEKLHFSIEDEEKLTDLTKHYIEGLQWVLFYYYKGCPSWNWYFRYHYAPRVSDISIGLEALLKNNETITFEKSKPFKPFEQLMAVLPARSRALMPVVYRQFMTDPQSPIIDFYPHEVDIDLNGKTASWEAVVLLSFVDENKLIKVLEPIESKLTSSETKRNTFGHDIQFVHNPQFDLVYSSPLPGFFHDIEHDNCIEEPFVLPEVKGENSIGGLKKGAKTGKNVLGGFPTLLTLPFDSSLVFNETKVFQNASRSQSIVLDLHDSWQDYSTKQFAENFLNKIVYSRWPYLRESKLVEVCDGEYSYEISKGSGKREVRITALEPSEIGDYKREVSRFRMDYLKTKAVKLNEITGLAQVQPVNGMIRNAQGAYVKTFSREKITFPIQLLVDKVVNEDIRFIPRPPKPVDEEFPVGSQVIFLGAFGYGAPSLVAGYSPDNLKLNIKVSKIDSGKELIIGKQRLEKEKKEIRYYPSYEVSKILQIPPLLLSKLTSGFILQHDIGKQPKKVNIGLELKFEAKRLKVLGYTKKVGNVWSYSPLAIRLIEDYKNKFPKIFKKLVATANVREILTSSKLGLADDEVEPLRLWLKDIKAQMVQVTLESESLTRFSFEAIEQTVINEINSGELNKFSQKDIKGVPKEAVINPVESYQLLNSQRFELGDRIIYVQDFGKVPYLSKGTVVSITPIGTKIQLGVIFDYPLLSGNNMGGKLKTNRGMTTDSSLVLNLTNKQLVYHSKASKGKPMVNEQEVLKKKVLQAQKMEKIDKKQSNEILSLINSKSKLDEGKKEDNEANKEAPNSKAINQIYGQIYSNVMNEGVPMVPGIPIPPQLQVPRAPPAEAVNGEESIGHNSKAGRGGRGGRGRGGSRGGRGDFRGRGRGNGRGRGRGN